jgi:hypothetical protein
MSVDLGPYNPRFDPAKNYKQILYRGGRGLQAAELLESQQIIMHELNRVTEALHTAGSLISGGETRLEGGNLVIKAGEIYALGFVHAFEEASFPVGPTADLVIGVEIVEDIITELEDPSLLEPYADGRNANQPGAHRHRMRASVILESEADNNNIFYPLHEVVDGQLVSEPIAAPVVSGLDQRFAKYDKSANGSYVVDGFTASFIADDSGEEEHIISVSAGTAHVEGYITEFESARRVRVPWATDTKAVNNEPINFTADGWYDLRWNPIASLAEVNGQKVVTRTITHGNFVGAQDLLPDTPVVSILSVTQGGTTYVVGDDYIQNGDRINWSPSGEEPAPGSTYTVEYVFQDLVNATISTDRTQIYLSGLRANSTVYVDYQFYIPRVDRMVLTQASANTGSVIKLLKGVPDALDPVPPNSSSGLQLATIYLSYGSAPVITADYFRAFKMSDIQALQDRMDTLDYNVTQLTLRDDINSSDPGSSRVGVFTDPFTNDDQRDPGLAQNALVQFGFLEAPIWSDDYTLRTGDFITLPSTESVIIKQDGYSKTRKVNEFARAELPPGVATVTPNSYIWTADTQVISSTRRVTVAGGNDFEEVTWQRHPGGDWSRWRQLGGSWESQQVITSGGAVRTDVSSSSRTRTSTRSADESAYSIPQINIRVKGEKFNAGETVNILFDNVEIGTTSADGDGLVDHTLQLPAGIPGGAKNVTLTGAASGVTADTTFHARPQINVINRQTTITTTVFGGTLLINWTDPIAQTFKPVDTFDLSSIDLYFANATSSFVDVILCETLNGYPNTGEVLARKRLYADDIVSGNWTNVTFGSNIIVEGDVEYAIVLMTQDTNLKVRVAQLGKYDQANNAWISMQNYLPGVLFNSSNATAWSAIQDEDLMFRIHKASYPVNTVTDVTLGTQAVTNATDLMILANYSVQPGAFAEFSIELSDRAGGAEIITAVPNVPVLVESYTGDVVVKAHLRTEDADITPVVSGDVQLAAGYIQFPADYITRAFPFTGDQMKVLLDIVEPSGSSVKVAYQSADLNLSPSGGSNWLGGSESIGLYYYAGGLLDGLKPAYVEQDGNTLSYVDAVVGMETDEYTWGDFDTLGSDALYIQMPEVILTEDGSTWTQSGTNTEWFYASNEVATKPSRVRVGDTELTEGTLGSLTEGQFAWGDNDTIGADRLYIRLPDAEVISGQTDPMHENYPENFVGFTYDPDTRGNNHIKGNQWVELTRGASKQVDNGFVEIAFASATGLSLNTSRVLIELDTDDDTARPQARKLRAWVV